MEEHKTRLVLVFLILFMLHVPVRAEASPREPSSRLTALISEIQRLAIRNPAILKGQSPVDIAHLGTANPNGDVLFEAFDASGKNLERIKESYPEIYSTFHPVFAGDLKGDGQIEIVTNRSSEWGRDVSEIVVFSRKGATVSASTKLIERTGMNLTVVGGLSERKTIVAEFQGSRHSWGADPPWRTPYIERATFGFDDTGIIELSPLSEVR